MSDKINLYHYRAFVTDVYDGDTITVDIDLGLGVWVKGEKIRLYGINTPEVRGYEKIKGIESRDFVRNKILNQDIILKTIKDESGKFGRLLGVVYYLENYSIGNRENKRYVELNTAIVSAGFGEFKEY